MPHPNHRRAFSLIELVIVVVIIGVLAAIAIPRMSSGADGAKAGAVKANLAVLRQAIELYNAEHGSFPTVADFATNLTKQTGTAPELKGPYIRSIPKLGVGTASNAASAAVAATTATASSVPTDVAATTAGWLYNASTGDIFANAAGYFDY